MTHVVFVFWTGYEDHHQLTKQGQIAGTLLWPLVIPLSVVVLIGLDIGKMVEKYKSYLKKGHAYVVGHRNKAEWDKKNKEELKKNGVRVRNG